MTNHPDFYTITLVMTKILRNYQDSDTKGIVQVVVEGADGSNHILLCWGTGLGKTIGAGVIIAELRHLFTHIIVATPADNIADQFRSEFSDEQGVPRTYQRVGSSEIHEFVPLPLIQPSNSNDLIEQIANGGFVVTTHAMLTGESGKAYLKGLASNPSNRILIVFDEAHHATTTRTDKSTECGLLFECLMASPNVTVIKMTATPYRSDGQPVYEGRYRFEQSLPNMMRQGWVTPELDLKVIRNENLNLQGVGKDGVTQGITNINTDREGALDNLANEVVQIWIDEGRVPTLIRFKFGLARSNREFIEALKKKFMDPNFGACKKKNEPLDVYWGTGKNVLRKAIKDEREAKSYDDIHSVILAVSRATEGMDSPVRCLGISIGMPRSEAYLAQLLGRIMRLRKVPIVDSATGGLLGYEEEPRWEGYPEEYLTKSKQIFIVEYSEDQAHERRLATTLTALKGYHEATLLHRLFKVLKQQTLLNERGVSRNIEALDSEEVELAHTLIHNTMRWWLSKAHDPLDRKVLSNDWVKLSRWYEYCDKRYWEYARNFGLVPFDGSESDDEAFKKLRLSDRAVRLGVTKCLVLLGIDSKQPAVMRVVRDTLIAEDLESVEVMELLDQICREYKLSDTKLDGHLIVDIANDVLKSFPSKRLTFDSLSKVEEFLQDHIEQSSRVPTKYRAAHNYLIANHSEEYPAGFPQFAIASLGYRSTWRDRLRELHQQKLTFQGLGKGDQWPGEALHDPVRVYLSDWIIPSIPDDLDLASACTMSPKKWETRHEEAV